MIRFSVVVLSALIALTGCNGIDGERFSNEEIKGGFEIRDDVILGLAKTIKYQQSQIRKLKRRMNEK